MGRGIEKRKIFRNATDRNDFTGRLSTLTPNGAMKINTWVLMPNYFHLLCKTKELRIAGLGIDIKQGIIPN
jgi:hypothetical protein